MVTNDLVTMITVMETASMFLTAIGIVVVMVTFHIGNQRSVATGGLFAGLVSILYGIFTTGISSFSSTFLTIGVGIIGVTGLVYWLLNDHSSKKVGGTA
jgi:hypothetical protein